MGLARIYLYTKFEVSRFSRSKDTAHVPLNGRMREGCAQTNACISVVFYRTTTKFGVTIVEWSMLNANVLDLRYVFTLSNYGANFLRLDMKILGFSATVRFRGHFEEIGIAKVPVSYTHLTLPTIYSV